MTIKGIWGWGSSSGEQGSFEHLFIAITPRSTLTLLGSHLWVLRYETKYTYMRYVTGHIQSWNAHKCKATTLFLDTKNYNPIVFTVVTKPWKIEWRRFRCAHFDFIFFFFSSRSSFTCFSNLDSSYLTNRLTDWPNWILELFLYIFC